MEKEESQEFTLLSSADDYRGSSAGSLGRAAPKARFVGDYAEVTPPRVRSHQDLNSPRREVKGHGELKKQKVRASFVLRERDEVEREPTGGTFGMPPRRPSLIVTESAGLFSVAVVTGEEHRRPRRGNIPSRAPSPMQVDVPQYEDVGSVELPTGGYIAAMSDGLKVATSGGSATVHRMEWCNRLKCLKGFARGDKDGEDSIRGVLAPRPPLWKAVTGALHVGHLGLSDLGELLGKIRCACNIAKVEHAFPDAVGGGDRMAVCRCLLCREVWGASRRILREHSAEADRLSESESKARALIIRWQRADNRPGSATSPPPPISRSNSFVAHTFAAADLIHGFVRAYRSGALRRHHGVQALRGALRQLTQSRGNRTVASARSALSLCREELRQLVAPLPPSSRTDSLWRLTHPPARNCSYQGLVTWEEANEMPLHQRVLQHALMIASGRDSLPTRPTTAPVAATRRESNMRRESGVSRSNSYQHSPMGHRLSTASAGAIGVWTDEVGDDAAEEELEADGAGEADSLFEPEPADPYSIEFQMKNWHNAATEQYGRRASFVANGRSPAASPFPPPPASVTLDTWFRMPDRHNPNAQAELRVAFGSRLVFRVTFNSDGAQANASGRKGPRVQPEHVSVVSDNGSGGCFQLQGHLPALFDSEWHFISITVKPVLREVLLTLDTDVCPGPFRLIQGTPCRAMLPRIKDATAFEEPVFWKPRLWVNSVPRRAEYKDSGSLCIPVRRHPPQNVAIMFTRELPGGLVLSSYDRMKDKQGNVSAFLLSDFDFSCSLYAISPNQNQELVLLSASCGSGATHQGMRLSIRADGGRELRRAVRFELWGHGHVKREHNFAVTSGLDDARWHRLQMRVRLHEVAVLLDSVRLEDTTAQPQGSDSPVPLGVKPEPDRVAILTPLRKSRNRLSANPVFVPLRNPVIVGAEWKRGHIVGHNCFTGYLHDIRLGGVTPGGESVPLGIWGTILGAQSPVVRDDSGGGWHGVFRLESARLQGGCVHAHLDCLRTIPCEELNLCTTSMRGSVLRRHSTLSKQQSPRLDGGAQSITTLGDEGKEEGRWADGIAGATRAELGRWPVKCYSKEWNPVEVERMVSEIRLWRDPKGPLWHESVLDRLEDDISYIMTHLLPKEPLELVVPLQVYTCSLGGASVWASWTLNVSYGRNHEGWQKVSYARMGAQWGPWRISGDPEPGDCFCEGVATTTFLHGYPSGLTMWFLQRETPGEARDECEYMAEWRSDVDSAFTPLQLPAQIWLPRPAAMSLAETFGGEPVSGSPAPSRLTPVLSPTSISLSPKALGESDQIPGGEEDEEGLLQETPFTFHDDPGYSFPSPGLWTFLMARSSSEQLSVSSQDVEWVSDSAVSLVGVDIQRRCLAERNQERRNVTLEDAFFTALMEDEVCIPLPGPTVTSHAVTDQHGAAIPQQVSAIFESPGSFYSSTPERRDVVIDSLAREKHGDDNWTPGSIAEFLELQLITRKVGDGNQTRDTCYLASISGRPVVAHINSGLTTRLWKHDAGFASHLQLYYHACASVRHEQSVKRDAIFTTTKGRYIAKQYDSCHGEETVPLRFEKGIGAVPEVQWQRMGVMETGHRPGHWVETTLEGTSKIKGNLDVYAWMLPQMVSFIYHLDAALSSEKLPGYSRMRSYRGLADAKLPEGLYEYGSVVCWAAFSSASEFSGTAMQFSKEGATGAGTSAVFSLQGATCKYVSRYSRLAREREALYPRNTYWSVRSMLSHEQQQILEIGIQVLELKEVDEFAVLENHVRLLIQGISSAHSMAGELVPLAENLFRVAAHLQTRDPSAALQAALDVRGEVLYKPECEPLVRGLRDLGADPELITATLREVCDGLAPLPGGDRCRAIQAVISLVSLSGGPQAASISGVNWHAFLTAQDLTRRLTPRRRSTAKDTRRPSARTLAASSSEFRATGSALHVAVHDPRLVPYVRRLVVDFALEVNERDSEGRQPLHIASALGHLTAVRDLLDAGAEPDGEEIGTRRTPLHYLAQAPGLATVLRQQEHVIKSIEVMQRELSHCEEKLRAVNTKIGNSPENETDTRSIEIDTQEELARGEVIEEYGAWRGVASLVNQGKLDSQILGGVCPQIRPRALSTAAVNFSGLTTDSINLNMSSTTSRGHRRSRGLVLQLREVRGGLLRRREEMERKAESLRSQLEELSRQRDSGIDGKAILRKLATEKARGAEDFRGLTPYDYAEWIQGADESLSEESQNGVAVLAALRECGCNSKSRMERLDERRTNRNVMRLRSHEGGLR
eukprot:Hpha_TRINITY_DN18958_c0_g1::TRINITY_DN18958_c0_g1_i1::g.17601::m.17601